MQQLTPAPFTPGMRKTQPAAVNRSHRRVPGIERPKRACIIPTLRQRWGEVVVVHRDEQESEEKATRQTRMQRVSAELLCKVAPTVSSAAAERRIERVFAISSVCLLGGADLRGFRATLDCGLQLIRDLNLLS